jgi:hypothetical protein
VTLFPHRLGTRCIAGLETSKDALEAQLRSEQELNKANDVVLQQRQQELKQTEGRMASLLADGAMKAAAAGEREKELQADLQTAAEKATQHADELKTLQLSLAELQEAVTQGKAEQCAAQSQG